MAGYPAVDPVQPKLTWPTKFPQSLHSVGLLAVKCVPRIHVASSIVAPHRCMGDETLRRLTSWPLAALRKLHRAGAMPAASAPRNMHVHVPSRPDRPLAMLPSTAGQAAGRPGLSVPAAQVRPCGWLRPTRRGACFKPPGALGRISDAET
eukprot:362822-Chlamydomonas_euryale.AAC.21